MCDFRTSRNGWHPAPEPIPRVARPPETAARPLGQTCRRSRDRVRPRSSVTPVAAGRARRQDRPRHLPASTDRTGRPRTLCALYAFTKLKAGDGHHVWVVDETRRTYRHHGRRRDAPRRIATFRHATQRVAPHRYATLEPLGKPGGSRAFSADGPPQAPVAPRRSCEAKYMRADEFAASRRAVLERRYRLRARARSGRPPSSNPDQPSCGLQRWSLAPGSVRFEPKSHKVAVLLGIILLPRF